MNSNDLTRLHRFIANHYDVEELRMLCFELSVDYDSLGGEGKAAKAREMLLYLGRRHKIGQMLGALRQSRSELFDKAGFSIEPAAIEALYDGLPSFENTGLLAPSAEEKKRPFLVVGTITALVCSVVLLAVVSRGKFPPTPEPTASSSAEPAG